MLIRWKDLPLYFQQNCINFRLTISMICIKTCVYAYKGKFPVKECGWSNIQGVFCVCIEDCPYEFPDIRTTPLTSFILLIFCLFFILSNFLFHILSATNPKHILFFFCFFSISLI